MAKLNRFTMPVFAGNAAQTQTSVFGTMKTSPQYTSDVAASIGTTAYGNGWADAIEIGYAPYLEDMNTLQRAITYQIAYNQQQGIPEWASDTTYYKDSLVKYNSGSGAQIYVSLTNNNTGNLVSDTSKWKLLLDSANGYVTTNTTQTITGRKTFTDRVYTNAEVVYIDNVTKGNAPSSVQYGNIYMVDSTKSWGDLYALGKFVTSVNSDGSVVSQMQAFKNEANSNVYGYLRMTYDTANNLYFASIGGSSSGTNYSLTRETNNTLVQTIPTMGWVNNPATSTNVVHRTGNETIGGSKTFTSSPYVSNVEPRLFLNSTDVTRGTAPSAKEVTSINFQDTNGDWYGFVQSTYDTDKSVGVFIGAKKSISSSDTASVYMGIGYDSSGNPYTSAPTPTDSYSTTSGTQITTTGWVGSNFVNVAGTQTITGEKTFTKGVTVHRSDPRVWLENTDAIKGTAPSSNLVSAFQFRDKNHELLGSVHSQYQTDKKIITQLLAYKANSASDTASVRMGVGYNYAGKEITFAPACDDYDSIVTTIGNSKAENGFFKLGNGLIIQWGRVSNTNNQNITLTFPTPFTSTNYSINAMRTSITGGGYSYDGITGVSSRATTSCVLYSYYGSSSYDWIAIGY
jgi:hypothetical protein